FFIIRAEENFLRAKFGAAFDDYLKRVPRWLPRLTPAYPGRLRDGRIDWRRGLKKEHNPIAAWALGALALLAWKSRAVSWPHLAAATLVLVLFIATKSWKRGWLSPHANNSVVPVGGQPGARASTHQPDGERR